MPSSSDENQHHHFNFILPKGKLWYTPKERPHPLIFSQSKWPGFSTGCSTNTQTAERIIQSTTPLSFQLPVNSREFGVLTKPTVR